MNNVITALIVSMIIVFSTTNDTGTGTGGGGGKGPDPKIVNNLNVLK